MFFTAKKIKKPKVSCELRQGDESHLFKKSREYEMLAIERHSGIHQLR